MSSEEPRAVSDADRRITLVSAMIVFLLLGLNQTVVATAMPRIIADLDGLPLYAWVTAAYLLTSTVMVPIWRKSSATSTAANRCCWSASSSSPWARGWRGSPASSGTCPGWGAA